MAICHLKAGCLFLKSNSTIFLNLEEIAVIVVAQCTHPSLHGSYMQETDKYSREMIAWLKTFLTDGPFEDLDMSSNYNPSPHHHHLHQTDGHCQSLMVLFCFLLQPMSGTPPAPGSTHPSCHLYLIYTFTLHSLPMWPLLPHLHL